MKPSEKARLYTLIEKHVHAQIALSAVGSQPPEDRPLYRMDADNARRDLEVFVKALQPSEHELQIMRLQREVHLLNRALSRKNRKLKGQYDALHQQKVPKPNSSVHEKIREYGRRGVQRGVLSEEEMVALLAEFDYANKGYRPMNLAFETRSFRPAYVQPPDTPKYGEPPLQRAVDHMRDNAYGFAFKTDDDEAAVYVERGTLGVVLIAGETWTITRLEHQAEGAHARIYAPGHEPRDITIPREAFR